MPDFAAHVRRHLPARGLRPDRYEQIVEELASELDARYGTMIARGASEGDAWQDVLAQIPSWPELARELAAGAEARRDASPAPRWARLGALALDRWRRDTRHGFRVLWKERGFAVTAIVTLAICLGGHAVIAAGVNAILLNPLRVPEPERVLLMANQYPRVEARVNTTSATPDYDDRRGAVTLLENQALYNYSAATIDLGGVPTRISGIVATPSLFRLLHVSPAHGRIFTESEGTPGNDQSVILSDGLWRDLYNGDTAALGRTLRLAGRDFTIVGVLPQDFSFGGPDIRFWIPLALTDRQRSDEARHSNGWFSIGRLKAGATIDQVRDQLKALDRANFDRAPAPLKPILASTGFYTSIEPLPDAQVRDVKTPLLLVWGAAVLVVLVGVVNLANLALVRSRQRLGEIGTRLAMGAGRFDIVRQLLVEALVVATLGAGIGLLLGTWALSALRTTQLTSLRDLSAVRIDSVVIGTTIAAAGAVALIIGLASAVPLFMPIETMLREEARGKMRGRAARSSRRTLVVAQMACSFVLLVGAGLLWVSVRHLLSVDPGFRVDDVITGAISLPPQQYASDDAARSFMTRSLDAIRALPSVAAAGATTIVPLTGNYQAGVILAEGHVPKPGETVVSGIRATVTPGYFEAVGTPLVRGRYFDERESDPATRSIIIDERLARHFWPDGDPIGRRMFRPANPNEIVPNATTRWLTVVGVVREAQLRGPAVSDVFGGTYYLPYAITAPRDVGFVIRTKTEPSSVVHDLRTTLAGIEREAPLFNVRTLAERMEISLILRTSTMRLAAVFAGVALLLSALGLYGALAYLVTQRTREIGVRMAIGSTPREIVGLVLREGMTLAIAGIIFGAAVFLVIRRVLTSQLFGVDAFDPRVMLAVTVGLVTVAIVACVYPARRAARVDVVQILSAR